MNAKKIASFPKDSFRDGLNHSGCDDGRGDLGVERAAFLMSASSVRSVRD